MTALLIAIIMTLSGWGINTNGLSQAQLEQEYKHKMQENDWTKSDRDGNGSTLEGAGK